SSASEPDLGCVAPSDEDAGTRRLRWRLDDGLLSGKDRLEGGFEPAMCILERIDSAGNHVVLLEHLLHCAQLLPLELSGDIGHQQLVAELGHKNLGSSG